MVDPNIGPVEQTPILDRGASCALDRLRHRYALHQPMPSVPVPREMLRYIKTHGLMLLDTSYTYLSFRLTFSHASQPPK
jgi:hypothetical protein